MVAQTTTTTSGTLIRNATRHEIVSTRMPPMNGPTMVVAAVAAAHTPYARPWASPLKFAVSSASDPGTRIAWTSDHRRRDGPRRTHAPYLQPLRRAATGPPR